MIMNKITTVVIIILLTLVSGWGDAQYFIHSAQAWNKGKIVWSEIFKSSLGVTLGVIMYWIAIKFMQDLKIFSTEIQTLIWFTVVIVGIALLSGKFSSWQLIDKIVSIMIILCIGWLLVRTGR